MVSIFVAAMLYPIVSQKLFTHECGYSIDGIFDGTLTQQNPENIWVLTNAIEVSISQNSIDCVVSMNINIPFGEFSVPTEISMVENSTKQIFEVDSTKHVEVLAKSGSVVRIYTAEGVRPSSLSSESTDSRMLYFGISNFDVTSAGLLARLRLVLGL
jgi:hypothetical protein